MWNLKGAYLKKYDGAVSCVSQRIKNILIGLDDKTKCSVYEIRLRSNRPVVLFEKKGSVFLCEDSSVSNTVTNNTVICTAEEVTDTFNRMCGYSIHTHQTSLNNGFVTLQGGHRAGVVGTAVCSKDGEIVNVRDISSINIRIAREIDGCSKGLVEAFFKNSAQSVIIAGPPSSGKTTVLRDLTKRLSSGEGCRCYKVALIDEREELAACEGSVCGNDVGINCDVLNDYPKKKGILLAVRSLSPEIIVCDEIGDEEEVRAIQYAVNTGVRFVITVHAADFDELVTRPQLRRILETYSFSKVVLLKCGEQPCTVEAIYDSRELLDEIDRRNSRFSFGGNDRHKNISVL